MPPPPLPVDASDKRSSDPVTPPGPVAPPRPATPPAPEVVSPLPGTAPAAAIDTNQAAGRRSPPPAPSPSRQAAFHVDGAAAWLQSFAGFGPSLAGVVRVAHPAPLGMKGRLTWVATLLTPKLEAKEGSVSLEQQLAVLEAVRPFGRGPLIPEVSLGFGVYRLSTAGSAAMAGYTGYSEITWAAAGTVGLGLSLRLSSRISVFSSAHACFIAPDPVVRIASVESGHAGIPILISTLGLSLSP